MKDEVDKALLKISDSEDISYSSLVSQIFVKHIEWDHRTEKYGYVHISKAFFKAFIELLTDNQLIDVGKKLGSSLPKEFIMFWWKQINITTFFEYIDILSKYAGIFQSERIEFTGYDVITLHHEYGRKWSSFLGYYIQSAIKTCLNIQSKIDLTDNSVIVKFNTAT